MAKPLLIDYWCNMCGPHVPAVETVKHNLGLLPDAPAWEIDLCEAHLMALHKAVSPFNEMSRVAEHKG